MSTRATSEAGTGTVVCGPAFHLKGFADVRGQVRVVARDDLARTFLASVADTSVGREVHAPELVARASQEVDRLSSVLEKKAHPAMLEANAASAIAHLLRGSFPPSEEHREHIAVFIAAYWLRGRDMGEATGFAMAQTAQTLATDVTKNLSRRSSSETENGKASNEDLDEVIVFEGDRAAHEIDAYSNDPIGLMLELIPSMANLAFAPEWQLLRASEGAFLTSDVPVSLWTHPASSHPFGGLGLSLADEIALPLDRRHALLFAREMPSGEIVREVGIDVVRALNLRTAASARRQIIHHPDDRLEDMVLPRVGASISIADAFRINSVCR